MHHVRLDELAQQVGRLPPVIVDGSGWFQVRAVTTNNQYYQFAATGPYYVEAPGGPHISRTSVEFFLAWLQEAAEKFRADDSLLQEIEAARPFWQRLADSATTD
ncbi:MAG TPA: hypothetical protein PJ982_05585, partial [Lacipirellulaceae bacterium]|nr:hypothetical protein [Lacipirellulaceae bacterium]